VELSHDDLRLVFHSEIVDRLTALAAGWFEDAGIPYRLLKGPSIARWLYDRDELRGYGDTDLLVPRPRWDDAVALLRSQGFVDAMAEMAHPRMESYTSHPWSSPGGDIDLHSTLHGLTVDMDLVWEELSKDPEPLVVAGRSVPTLQIPARLLHIALHASQHQDGQAPLDLERALVRATTEQWADAAALARRLGGAPAFADGLRLRDGGRELAVELGLGDVTSVETLLHAGAVPLTESLYELRRTPGLRRKATLLAREAVPTTTFIRWWSPLARRGRLGLALAYLWRPVYLLMRLPRALLELRRAHRAARSSD
jgi:hypothetical protein